MAKRTPSNERLKRRYLQFLKEVKRRDPASIDAAAAAIERYDSYMRYREFWKFHTDAISAFKEHFAEQRNVRTGEPLSAATIHSTFSALKAFFIWLADQPECRGKITYTLANWFNSPDNLSRVATAKRYRPGPSLDHIRKALAAMPTDTDVQRRDRAIVAAAIVTGARDLALTSFKLKHVDLEAQLIEHDARSVRTKRAKTFTTWFFPVGEDIEQILVDWVEFLRAKGFGPNDPIFPKSKPVMGRNLQVQTVELAREHWANASPVRKIFKVAFEAVGLPYPNPHSFRKTLVEYAYSLDLSAEQMKAWSQNLGHDDVLTTFCSYGTLPPGRQGQIIRGLARRDGRP
jgi:integrase